MAIGTDGLVSLGCHSEIALPYVRKGHTQFFHPNKKQAWLLCNSPLDPLNLSSLTSALSRFFWVHVFTEDFPTTLFPGLSQSALSQAVFILYSGTDGAHITCSILRQKLECKGSAPGWTFQPLRPGVFL